jgi:outer membrane protein, multidrug efflux system
MIHIHSEKSRFIRNRPGPVVIVALAIVLVPGLVLPLYVCPQTTLDTTTHLQTDTEAETLSLDIETAVLLALHSNLGLRDEELDLEIARRNKQRAWNVFLPQIAASGTLARSHVIPENPMAPLSELFPMMPEPEEPPRWNLSPALSANLTLSFQMIHAIRAVRLAYEAGEIELADARRALEREVRKSFYDLLLQQKNLDLAEERAGQAEDRYQQAVVNYRNGLVDEYSMLSARVAWENQKPSIRGLRVGLETALMSFKQTIGLPRDLELELEGSIEVETVRLVDNGTLLSLIERNAGVQGIRRAIEMQENQVRLSRSEMYPTFTLGYTERPQFAGDPLETGDLQDDELWSRGGEFSLTLRLPLDPWIPGSQIQTRVDNTRTEIMKLRNRLQETVQNLELQVISTVRRLEASLETLEILSLNLDLAERAYELASEAYAEGLRELSEVHDAELELQNARLRVIEEQYQYITGLLDLEYHLNTPLEELQEHTHEQN